jgi:hypothetical protein
MASTERLCRINIHPMRRLGYLRLLQVIALIACLGAFAIRGAELEHPVEFRVAENRPEPPPSQQVIEELWRDPADLPLNNVFSILGAEFNEVHVGQAAALRRQARQIVDAYLNERALAESAKLKINRIGTDAAEKLEISRHNARVAEYGALVREIPRLSLSCAAAAEASDIARRKIEQQLGRDPSYQSATEQLQGLRNQLFDLVHKLAVSQSRVVALSQQAAVIRDRFEKGESPLGQERNRMLTDLQLSREMRNSEIEKLTNLSKTQTKEMANWEMAQQKRSQELVDEATKNLNTFNAFLPALTKAGDQLAAATKSLNIYLNSGEKLKRSELRKRKEAFAAAQANYDQARQKSETLKNLAENSRAATADFADSWSAEAKKRNKSSEEIAAKLKALEKERDKAPTLANREIEKLYARLEAEMKPLNDEARRQRDELIETFGANYNDLIDATSDWISGSAGAANTIAAMTELRLEPRKNNSAQKIHALLAKAANLEKQQDEILSTRPFEPDFFQKQQRAVLASKSLSEAKAKAAVLKRALIAAQVLNSDPSSTMREGSNFERSVDGLRGLLDQKQSLAESEFLAAEDVFRFAMGASAPDPESIKRLQTQKSMLDAGFKKWAKQNLAPSSSNLAARIESFCKTGFNDSLRSPISKDQIAIPTGDPLKGIPGELPRELTPDEWRRWISGWFKNLEQREDGLDLIERQLTRAMPYASQAVLREGLHGLMQRAFAARSSAEILGFANRQSATLIHMDDGRRFTLTRFWSLKSLPSEKPNSEEEAQQLVGVNEFVRSRGAGIATTSTNPVDAELEAPISEFVQAFSAAGDLPQKWGAAVKQLDSGDGKEALAFFGMLQQFLEPQNAFGKGPSDSMRKAGNTLRDWGPGIIDAKAAEFVTSVREYRTNRTEAVGRLAALKTALESNIANLQKAQARLTTESKGVTRMRDSLTALSELFAQDWERAWSAGLGNGLTGAWYSVETFVEQTSDLTNEYQSAIWRIDQALAIEQDRQAAVQKAFRILDAGETGLAASR